MNIKGSDKCSHGDSRHRLLSLLKCSRTSCKANGFSLHQCVFCCATTVLIDELDNEDLSQSILRFFADHLTKDKHFTYIIDVWHYFGSKEAVPKSVHRWQLSSSRTVYEVDVSAIKDIDIDLFNSRDTIIGAIDSSDALQTYINNYHFTSSKALINGCLSSFIECGESNGCLIGCNTADRELIVRVKSAL